MHWATYASLPLLLMLLACGSGEPYRERGPARAPAAVLGFPLGCARAAHVYFVPIGPTRQLDPSEVVARYRDTYGLPGHLLPSITPGSAAIDSGREQLVAEELAVLMARHYPQQAADDQSVLIGITEGDMYTRSMDWRFAFASRWERMAVVSTARMDPGFHGNPTNLAALYARAYKMLTKQIGVLYCGAPLSDNPRSVMHGEVLGLADLDRMDESVW